MKIYSGIGSRETPFDIQLLMTDIAIYLAQKGYILRSGHAKGADLAFENGVDSVNKNLKEIYTADDCTKEALEMGLKFHPNPKALKTDFVRRLMGRNCQIVLGRELNIPSQNIIFYAIEDELTREVSGGTGQAIRLSRYHKIPCFNLYFKDVREKFMRKIY